MKKKVVLLSVMLVAILAFAGCGKKPEATVDAYCKAMQKTDMEEMNKLMESGQRASELTEDEDIKELLDYIKSLNENIEYDITDVKIDGDRADVTVEFKYDDATEVISETVTTYVEDAIALAFSGDDVSDEQMQQLFTDTLNEKKGTVETTKTTKTVTIGCTKEQGEWLICDAPEELSDVMSGNIVTALGKVSSAMTE